jgi:hypothetical protein
MLSKPNHLWYPGVGASGMTDAGALMVRNGSSGSRRKRRWESREQNFTPVLGGSMRKGIRLGGSVIWALAVAMSASVGAGAA